MATRLISLITNNSSNMIPFRGRLGIGGLDRDTGTDQDNNSNSRIFFLRNMSILPRKPVGSRFLSALGSTLGRNSSHSSNDSCCCKDDDDIDDDIIQWEDYDMIHDETISPYSDPLHDYAMTVMLHFIVFLVIVHCALNAGAIHLAPYNSPGMLEYDSFNCDCPSIVDWNATTSLVEGWSHQWGTIEGAGYSIAT